MNIIINITIKKSATIKDALVQLENVATGVLLLVDEEGYFLRTVTDGDIRRLILDDVCLEETLEKLPKVESILINAGFTSQSALDLMNKHVINHLPVIDSRGIAIQLLARKDVDRKILLSTPHMGEREMEFIEEAFRTNWIAPLGPNVDSFEREVANLIGVGHAAAVSSGTAAIHLALVVLEVGRGDTVFCSSFTFAASANPIIYQGAEPVFIDSEPESWNMSPFALEDAFRDAKLRGRMPRAVIVVNLYGQSADFDSIVEICKRYDVPIVEDAAESLGALYKGRHSGTFGTLGVFSFNGNKIITTSGGGMLVSDDEALILRARFLATQAREVALHYEHQVIGFNYRMSNILAGVGRGQLSVLAQRVAARREVFNRYKSGLKRYSVFQWMPEPTWSRSNRWLSTCTVDTIELGMNVEQLIRKLADERIEARPLWKPMQLQPVFSQFSYFPHQGLSVSEQLFKSGICLPSGSNLSSEQQDIVIQTLANLASA